MKQVYLFSPLPPVKSGIARYSKVLVEHLSEHYKIHVVTAQKEYFPDPAYQVHHWTEFLRRPIDPDAVVIYQIGNSPYHRYVFPYLFTYPGIVFLHDFILTDIRFSLLRQFYSSQEIMEELRYCIRSDHSAKQLASFLTDGLLTADSRFLFPELSRVIVESSLATVVHNPDTREALLLMYPEEPVYFIPFGFWAKRPYEDLKDESIRKKRKVLRFPENAFILGHFGVASAYKRVDQLIELVSRLREKDCPAYLLVVGFETQNIDLNRVAEKYNVQNYVKEFSNVTNRDYWDLIKCIDVGYSLRFPPVGEFSLSTAELMASAKPVILLQHRFSAYLPDETCIKIAPTCEMDELVQCTLDLYHSPGMRHEMGKRARDYIRRQNSLESMLQGYRSLIEAFDYLKRNWKDPRPNFPRHLQSLQHRFTQELNGRFQGGLPEKMNKEIAELLSDIRLPDQRQS